jgi:hypothetical protein
MVMPFRKVLNSYGADKVATKALITAATMLNATLIQYITTNGFKELQSSQIIFWTYIKKLPIYKLFLLIIHHLRFLKTLMLSISATYSKPTLSSSHIS